MDLRNSNGTELRSFYFATTWKLFSKIFIKSGKMHHVELKYFQNTSKSKKSFCTFEDIDLRDSHAKLHKNRSENLGGDSI